MTSDRARLFILGFKRGWREAPSSRQTFVATMVISAIVTSIILIVQSLL